jgi:hypothetical protein
MSAGGKLALAMIPEIDIWRAASLMLKRYGEKALEESAARADELFAEQDHDGAAVWRRIIDAVGQLANTTPSANSPTRRRRAGSTDHRESHSAAGSTRPAALPLAPKLLLKTDFFENRAEEAGITRAGRPAMTAENWAAACDRPNCAESSL